MSVIATLFVACTTAPSVAREFTSQLDIKLSATKFIIVASSVEFELTEELSKRKATSGLQLNGGKTVVVDGKEVLVKGVVVKRGSGPQIKEEIELAMDGSML